MNFLNADSLAGEDRAEIDLFPTERCRAWYNLRQWKRRYWRAKKKPVSRTTSWTPGDETWKRRAMRRSVPRGSTMPRIRKTVWWPTKWSDAGIKLCEHGKRANCGSSSMSMVKGKPRHQHERSLRISQRNWRPCGIVRTPIFV